MLQDQIFAKSLFLTLKLFSCFLVSYFYSRNQLVTINHQYKECIDRHFFLLQIESILILHIAPFMFLIFPLHTPSPSHSHPLISGLKIEICSFRVIKFQTLRRLTLFVSWKKLPKMNVHRKVIFRTLQNIYDEDFYAKIVNS